MSANFRSTPSALSKFLTTSGCAFFVESFTRPSRKRDGFTKSKTSLTLTDPGAPGLSEYSGTSLLDEVGSFGSRPAMAASTSPVSSAVRHIGPILSSVQHSAMAPWRLTLPYVGRSPVMPQYVEGFTIEPLVSEPIAKATRPAPIAAPGPLEEPPVQ